VSRTRFAVFSAPFPFAALAAFALLATFASARDARAEGEDERFRGAVASLSANKPQEAIAQLEALRDEGVEDAAVSFDLGLAYLSRAKIQESPGDLGRAVHAFEEARVLTSDSNLRAECTHLSGEVRSIVAKRRARVGLSTDMEEAPPPGRAFANVLPEATWAVLGLGGSALLLLALFVRWKGRGRARIAASIAAAAGAVVAIVSGFSAHERKVARETQEDGIVVADEVRPTDEKHIVLTDAPSLAAGMRVAIEERRAGYARVRAHKVSAWVPERTVLALPKER
jgi:hypothetical protein